MTIEGKNPYRDYSDDALIQRAADQGIGPYAMIGEVSRRLKDSVDEQNRASTALAERITDLNERLLKVTIVIGALTVVQILLGVVQVVIAMKGSR